MSSPTNLAPLLNLDKASSSTNLLADTCASVLRDTGAPVEGAAPRAARALYESAALRGLTADQLEAELRSAGLSADGATSAAQSWTAYGAAARRSLLLSTLSVRRLVDVEWTFGVTACSSEHAAAGTTYVQLRLLVSSESSGALEYVHAGERRRRSPFFPKPPHLTPAAAPRSQS